MCRYSATLSAFDFGLLEKKKRDKGQKSKFWAQRQGFKSASWQLWSLVQVFSVTLGCVWSGCATIENKNIITVNEHNEPFSSSSFLCLWQKATTFRDLVPPQNCVLVITVVKHVHWSAAWVVFYDSVASTLRLVGTSSLLNEQVAAELLSSLWQTQSHEDTIQLYWNMT